MNLICRRLLSFVINSSVILIILSLLFILTASLAWFIPCGSLIDVRTFSFLFGISYSLLGSYSIGRLPQLGKTIAGIQQQSVRSNPPHKVKIIISLAMYSFLSFILLFGSSLLTNIIDFNKLNLPLALTVFLGSMSLFILPVSIIIGKGKQGLHDIIAGLAVCRRGAEIGDLVPVRSMLKKASTVTVVLSLISTMVMLFTIPSIPSKDIIEARLQKIVTDFGDLSSVTRTNNRIIQTAGGLKWWVDFSNNPNEQVKVSQKIGLSKGNQFDLIGYGFNVSRLNKPVELVDMSRSVHQTLQPGAALLSFSIFVDAGAFYFEEVKKTIHSHFAPQIIEYSINNGIEAIRISTIRMIKVGYIKIGFEDKFYLLNDGYYRENDSAYYPVIFTWSDRFDPAKGLISGADLE